MIRLGLTLRAEADPRHIWIVLSDPTDSPDGAILLVNLTTLTEKCVDDCCILLPADYPVLKHKTVVAFSRAKKGYVQPLANAISWGQFVEMSEQIPSITLQRILAAARTSRNLPAAKKRLLPAV